MGFITTDRSQSDLLGYRIEDFAKADPKSRFVVDIVSQLDLSVLYTRYSTQGGDSYAPDMMLALWFFGYSEDQIHTRDLEQSCKFDTRYMYITGNQRPDHTTLSRFRKANIDLMSEYFIQILLLAQESGISDFKHIAIDGTKIRAKSSGKHSYTEDQLNQRIENLRKDIAHYMQRCDLAEQGAEDELDLDALREEKARLEELEQKLIQRKDQLQKRKQTLKPENRDKHQINILEPDARFMPKSEGPSYNAQAAVDTETHLIVAADVTDQPNDQGQLIPMIQQVDKNISADPDRSHTTDAGYHNTDDLEVLKKNNTDVIAADPKPNNRSIEHNPTPVETILEEQRKVERKDFVYHGDGNYYQCPNGNKLVPVKNKGKRTVYRSEGCQDCPLFNLCVPSKKQVKQIQRSHKEAAAEWMARKLSTDEAKTRMKIRATTVEPVFGNIKQNLGFRRFSLKGLQNALGEYNLICIAHNLNVLFKMIQDGRLTALNYASYLRINQFMAISKIILTILVIKIVRINFYPAKKLYASIGF
jgi:transposase